MRTTIIINIFLFLLLSSCVKDKKDKLIKEYYPAGEIFRIASPINNSDSAFYVKWYSESGRLLQEGKVINNLYEGYYKIYFEDGALQWEGHYKKGVIQGGYEKDFTWVGVEKYYQHLEYKTNPKNRQIGDTLKFRVIMPKIHPKFYMVYDLDYNLLYNDEDFDLYTCKYIPTESGRVYFRIMFIDKNGAFIVGNPEFIIDVGIDIE